MAKDEMDVVSLLRKAVVDRIGQDRMEMWLRGGEALRVETGMLLVSASDEFALDRIRRHLREDLLAVAEQVLGERPQVVFQLDQSLRRGKGQDRAKPRVLSNQRLFDFIEREEPSQQAAPIAATPIAAPRIASPSVENDKPAQGRRFARLETFVVSDASRFAHAAAHKAVKQPGQASPLYFYGPTGSGKTHLAEGIWSATKRSPGNRHCVYLAAEQFTTQFLESLNGQGLPSFRRKIREVDLLVIDDIQFLHGKRATLQELLNTVEHFSRERKQLVLTADRPPAELPSLGAELVARLSSGLVADLPTLDEPTRRSVLMQLLAQRGCRLPDDVLDMVAHDMPGDGRRLQGALNRLEAMYEATGKPITLSVAREALKDLVRTSQKMIRLIDIEQAVCEVFGLPPKSLHSEVKSRQVTKPRMLAMWLARKYTRAGLSEISNHFGLRSHSTVVAAHKKVTGWMDAKSPVSLLQGECDTPEAIRRVEAALRAM